MTGEDLPGDHAKTGREADALDREAALDPETRAALADVRESRRAGTETRQCSTCGGHASTRDDCPECDGEGRVPGGDTSRRTSGGPL